MPRAKYLAAARAAGGLYRPVAAAKGEDALRHRGLDGRDRRSRRRRAELLVILAAIADEGIPAADHRAQVHRPLQQGRRLRRRRRGSSPREFDADIAVIASRPPRYGLPGDLKLSVHSGSDKFSHLRARSARRSGGGRAGVHLKTAGTTWLEELIGLAEAGGDGLALAKEVYAGAYAHRRGAVRALRLGDRHRPREAAVAGRTCGRGAPGQFAARCATTRRAPPTTPHLRQLLHVGYKVAAEMGDRLHRTAGTPAGKPSPPM